MKDMKALTDFLGEDEIKIFKEKLMQIILDRVESDLEECGEYMLCPDDISELIYEVQDEFKKELKHKIKLKYMEKYEKMVDDIVV